jgi:hypothetical protein
MSETAFIKAFALALSLNLCCLLFYIGKHLLEIEQSLFSALLKVLSNAKIKKWILFTLFLLSCHFYIIYKVANG